MGFFQRIKQALGLVKAVQPYISVPIVDEVAELAEKIRGVNRVGDLRSPNSLCLQPGHYGLIRAGELVARPDGVIETCRMEVGVRFPPGLTRGDRWQRFDNAAAVFDR